MKIYLAGSWSRRAELDGYRKELEDRGFPVTSSWLNLGHHDADDDGTNISLDHDKQAELAKDNLDDIYISDVLVVFTEEPGSAMTRGGRHVEFGFALATYKEVWTVGPMENIFYTLSNRHAESFADLLENLPHWHKERA